jgi:hypothetical protein
MPACSHVICLRVNIGRRWVSEQVSWAGHVIARTLNRDPRTERITIAKTEMTTLEIEGLLDSVDAWAYEPVEYGEPYQDQAFNADTTGFIAASSRKSGYELSVDI